MANDLHLSFANYDDLQDEILYQYQEYIWYEARLIQWLWSLFMYRFPVHFITITGPRILQIRSSNSANTLSASGLMQYHIGKSHFSKVLAQRNSTAAQIILPASHAGNCHWWKWRIRPLEFSQLMETQYQLASTVLSSRCTVALKTVSKYNKARSAFWTQKCHYYTV